MLVSSQSAIIRDRIEIGDNAVIMMGCNQYRIAEIGAGTMIDWVAILGGVLSLEGSHVGAGAGLAGVIEPASADQSVHRGQYSHRIITSGRRRVSKSVVFSCRCRSYRLKMSPRK